MYPTMFEIGIAVLLLAVNVAAFSWIHRSESAATSRRMTRMMARVGVAPGAAALGGPRAEAALRASRRRCARCPREGLCERWLAGEVEGGNAFCPNARAFSELKAAG